MHRPDVIVIGGGVIGCTCAWRLALTGRRVVLLERGQCGRESSWAGAGIIDAGSLARTDPVAALRRVGVARYPAFIAELKERSGLDPEFVECGGLDLIFDDNQEAAAEREVEAATHRRDAGTTMVEAAAEREVEAAAEPKVQSAAEREIDAHESWGLANAPHAERLSAEAARKLEPALTAEIRGALYSNEEMQVRNPRLMAALRAACVAAGVDIRENTPVHEIKLSGERVIGVRTDGGTLVADRYVLAAGAWSSQLHPRLAERMPVRPVRGQIVLLDPPPGTIRHIIYSGSRYLVPRLDGKLLVGSTLEPESGYDSRPTAKGVAGLLRAAERIAPTLKHAPFVTAWGGLRPGSGDGRPYIGPVPEFDGLIAATGHYRSGLTLAPLTADLITELIAQGRTQHDLTPFMPGRALPS